jgi:hypothetical protein
LQGSLSGWGRGRHNDVNIEPNQLGSEGWEAIVFSLCVSVLNNNVLPLHVPMLTQTLAECLGERRGDSGRIEPQDAYPGDFLRVLRGGDMDGSQSQTDQ